eukprot:scaffold2747_cov104-Cylindrotheca_fusiformis.AAC.12
MVRTRSQAATAGLPAAVARPPAAAAENASNNDERLGRLVDFLGRHNQINLPTKQLTCVAVATKLLENIDPNYSFDSLAGAARMGLADHFVPNVEVSTRADISKAIATIMLLQKKEEISERRVIDISYNIVETELTYLVDYGFFEEYILWVLREFYDAAANLLNEADRFNAPYFAFIQSSGMGKTKLLFHFAKKHPCKARWVGEKREGDWRSDSLASILILCHKEVDLETDARQILFDEYFDCQATVKEIRDKKLDFENAAVFVDNKLTKMIEGQGTDLVLLFDESHNLLKTSRLEGDVEYPGLLFRLVRLSLVRRRRKQRVVAVFTGTSGGHRELDRLAESPDTFSREVQNKDQGKYYRRGSKMFKEFFSMTTIGCLRKHTTVPGDPPSEYAKSIPYGRPLFASMQNGGRLGQKAMSAIAERMLLISDASDWTMEGSSKDSWISILGTRVQMGRTSIDISSSLVAHGYANLVSVTEATTKICFPPDPVCARLAMCLMDKDWRIPNTRVRGKEKTWWVERAKILFSGALCVPDRGDFGEVMVALYFLLCADEERKVIDASYETFSVPLDAWLDRLVHGGNLSEKFKTNQKKFKTNTGPTFGAIQICRNYLRAYDKNWKELGDSKFLEAMYESGVGFYVFEGCRTIDLVFPLKITDAAFVPMVVSVKSRSYFSPEEVNTELSAMRGKAGDAEWKHCLCLLVLFGSDKVQKSDEVHSTVSSQDAETLLEADGENGNGILTRILYIPAGDSFDISTVFKDLTAVEQESEVLSASSFLSAHVASMKGSDGSAGRRKGFVDSCLRKGTADKIKTVGKLVREIAEQTSSKKRAWDQIYQEKDD